MITIKSIEERRQIFPKIVVLLLVAYFLLLTSCNDADKFYDKLDLQPEVAADYEEVYSVGDNLTLNGRLHPENNLIVHIGGIQAAYKAYKVESPSGDFDRLTIAITEEMGIGEERPITLTSSGITINAPSIEIVGDANASIYDKQLQLIKVADIPSGSTPVYCRSGNGNVYAFNSTTKKLFKITGADGNVTEVFDESKLTDGKGSFIMEEFNAGAVSPDEKYFYFSAKVKESGQGRTVELYKLCRYDLQNGGLTTLNRTEYSILKANRTLKAAQPFEGKVDEVKIYKITAIYPDSHGNIYFDLVKKRFLTLLDSDNQYSYVLNMPENISRYEEASDTQFIPQMLDPDKEQAVYLSTLQIHQYLPGAKLKYTNSNIDFEHFIDPEQKRRYYADYAALRVADLITKTHLDSYDRNSSNISNLIPLYITASLKRFNGDFVNKAESFKPIPIDGKLYGIFFRDSGFEQTDRIRKYYEKYEIPTVCVIDLENKTATRIAKGKLLYNGFTIAERTDYILNYNAERMLYMTADNGTVIVKTVFVE